MEPPDSDQGYAANAVALLKSRGYRSTRPRRLVLEALGRASAPLSAYELADTIRASGEHADVVSVYRIVECLEQNGLLHRSISTGKYRRCELGPEDECQREQGDHCHHDLVCRGCGTVQELHCPGLSALVAEVSRTARFQVEQHRLEFIGLCRACG